MDPLDFAIYRFLSPQGEARFWAGRRLIDPTIPARKIAEQVGISENAVRARLRGLAQHGYLRGTMVIPNPALFGVRVFVVEIPVKDVGEVDRVFRDLALVEGVVFARDTIDEGDRQVRVHFVSDGDSSTNRRSSLVRRLSPSNQLRGPRPYWIPSCEKELTPLDWRILLAVSRKPDATLAETARSVGISLKTAARRYHGLIDSRACWWTHAPDSEEFPLALLQVEVEDAKQRAIVAERLAREVPGWMPVAADGLGIEPDGSQTLTAGLVPADAPAVLEKLIRKCKGLPGVVGVRRTFALGSTPYSSWFADRIAEHVPKRS
ncbi:MAG TPA: winged helix-turn-helix transcriptional regulator [Thermoplasmata archaeon]|nr:winged helix-turn-helix transcriptional regulator [Thermoplasmata archaeon]